MRATIIVVATLIAAFLFVSQGRTTADTCSDACDRAYASCAKSCKASATDCFTKCINEKNACLVRCG